MRPILPCSTIEALELGLAARDLRLSAAHRLTEIDDLTLCALMLGRELCELRFLRGSGVRLAALSVFEDRDLARDRIALACEDAGLLLDFAELRLDLRFAAA